MLHAFAGGTLSKEQRLYEAAKANDLQKAASLLKLNANPDGHRQAGSTALHAACQHKHAVKDIVSLLLVAGADPGAADGDAWTPLHWAAYSDAEAAVALLLEHGADPNARNQREESPLHWAARNNAGRAVKVLAGHPKVDLSARCKDLETPLEWARRCGSQAAQRELESALGSVPLHVSGLTMTNGVQSPWLLGK